MSAYSEKNPSLRVLTYRSGRPGPKLLITGAVHGDEIAGPKAIREIESLFAEGKLSLTRGQLTFVPVVNAKAYAQGTRMGDRNFNRDLRFKTVFAEYEDHIANALFPILAEHDVLLDLHSFADPGKAFVFVGPEDNNGNLEPFSHAAAERAFAKSLGVDTVLMGWLSAYEKAVIAVKKLAAKKGEAEPLVNPMIGVGTTELMRRLGGYAVTLECGQHQDPHNVEVAKRAIMGALNHLKLVEPVEDFAPVSPATYRLTEAIIRHSPADRFVKLWKHFDPIKQGEPVAILEGEGEVKAPYDGVIVFPYTDAKPLTEWLYFAKTEKAL
ncbi:putative deacylase [Rhizomicrobium palustre]|uniref:Putative deacylase n=1 Tax=Rhizomicrobium palustre TaxID=189966 RepID=A0A846MXX0_9PROT|nr:succinylglutamate desuccinylase/aspartoacylase family protein [Rhizomicrobium palustre]NIK87860.1 putative deacylase [Rhizomicrobium palustre]